MSGTKSLITGICGSGYILRCVSSDTFKIQANVFVPLIFIEHDPQIPSLQDLLNASVESTLFFIYSNTSRPIGPNLSLSSIYVSKYGLEFKSGLYL